MRDFHAEGKNDSLRTPDRRDAGNFVFHAIITVALNQPALKPGLALEVLLWEIHEIMCVLHDKSI